MVGVCSVRKKKKKPFRDEGQNRRDECENFDRITPTVCSHQLEGFDKREGLEI